MSNRPSRSHRDTAPTAHPSVESWHQYYSRQLPDAEAADLRQHLSECRQCIDLVLDLDAFADPPAAKSGVADFQQAAVWRTVKNALERPAPRARHWPAVAAVAASLLFAVVGLSQRGARIETEARLAQLIQLQPNAQILDLRPGALERSSGGVDATVDLPADGATLVLHLEDEVDYPAYQLRVVDAAGVEVNRVSDLRISEFGNFSLGLPPGTLAAGRYDLRLFGLAGEREEELETYPIRLP